MPARKPCTSSSDMEWPASAVPWPRSRRWRKRRVNTTWISPRLSASYREQDRNAAADLDWPAMGIARFVGIEGARRDHEEQEQVF